MRKLCCASRHGKRAVSANSDPTVLTDICLQTIAPAQLFAAQQNLAHEANVTASLFDHANLLKPVAILYADADRQHVAGLVYPLMEGGDVWGILK